MVTTVSLRKISRCGGMAAAGAGCLLMAVYSQGCRKGAAEGIALCLNVLAPSLFPFMAAAGLAVRSGLCRRLGRLLRCPTAWLFGLDGAFAPVVLLSLIGGYPVGARAIATLYREGQVSAEQARQAALFCVCAGPGFLLSFVGGMYGGAVGGVILAAQAASVLLLGIAARVLLKKRENVSNKELSFSPLPFGDALVASARDAARGMVGICSLVVVFAAVGGVIAELLPPRGVAAVLSVLEVCTAVQQLGDAPVELCALAVGFGGLCVHFQIFAALGGVKVNKGLFFLFRMVQGVLTAALTHVGLRLFVRETAVFSTAAVGSAGFFGGSALSGAALLTVALAFLLSLRKQTP